MYSVCVVKSNKLEIRWSLHLHVCHVSKATGVNSLKLTFEVVVMS